jgi:hypothetical protein
MNASLHAALAVAATGLPVFPCRPDNKRPLTENGFYDATTDREEIERQWRKHPRALIGVPTGPRAGFFVVDLDGVEHGGPCGLTAWDQLTASHAAPPTRRHETPRGGIHLFFRYDPERPVGNRRGDLPAGIDVRGSGGYIIWPPSRLPDGRAWRVPETCETDAIADAPECLYDLIAEKPAAKAHTHVAHGGQAANGNGAYVEAALADELAAVARARQGVRNETLNRAAFNLGQLVGAGALSGGDVEERLYGAAVASGLVVADGARAVRKTIKSGLDAGMRQPRAIPERNNGWPSARPQPEPPRPGEPVERSPQDAPLRKLVPICFVKDEAIPEREWTVPGWIPKRKVTLLQGDGGDGKTPLMQQLQSSCATGLPWLGLPVNECCSIGVYTEDEERDLKIRQAAIDAHYGRDCALTGKMQLFPRTDQECELIVFARTGRAELTPFYRQLVEAALDYRVGLVTLDAR